MNLLEPLGPLWTKVYFGLLPFNGLVGAVEVPRRLRSDGSGRRSNLLLSLTWAGRCGVNNAEGIGGVFANPAVGILEKAQECGGGGGRSAGSHGCYKVEGSERLWSVGVSHECQQVVHPLLSKESERRGASEGNHHVGGAVYETDELGLRREGVRAENVERVDGTIGA